MYFIVLSLTVALAGSLISARTLCGYNNISLWSKILVFFLLLVAWTMPAILGVIRSKGWVDGELYNILSLCGYFLFGFAFLLFAVLLLRDILWALVYGAAKLSAHASDSWSPMNVGALTKANIITFAGVILVAFYALYAGTKTPAIREIEIVSPKIDREIKILQVNDMHIDRTKPVKWFADMVEQINLQQPDLIVMPGDIIDDRMDAIPAHLDELKKLKSPHGIYFSPGNHEFYNGLFMIQWGLRNMGFVWLSENGQNVDGLPLYIAGIPDGPQRYTKKEYPRLLEGAADDSYKILLSHNPSKAGEYLGYGFDLQLSAHTHGGQIFPFHIPVKMINNYLAGLYELPEGKLYISRGAGYWGPPMRLLAPSDMTLIRLKPQEEKQ